MKIAFNDEASCSRVLSALAALTGLHVEVSYAPGDSPYCENPVEVVRVDDDGDLVVAEVVNGRAVTNSTWAIPQNAIEEVTVL